MLKYRKQLLETTEVFSETLHHDKYITYTASETLHHDKYITNTASETLHHDKNTTNTRVLFKRTYMESIYENNFWQPLSIMD